MAKRTKLPAKRQYTKRQAVKLLSTKPRGGKPVTLVNPRVKPEEKHPPPLKVPRLDRGKMGAAPQVAKRRGRPPKMATTKDDNGAPATKPGAKGADAALTQDQVDAGVNVVLQHPGGMGVSKPDDLVRKVDAAVHGYELKPAE